VAVASIRIQQTSTVTGQINASDSIRPGEEAYHKPLLRGWMEPDLVWTPGKKERNTATVADQRPISQSLNV